MIGIETDRRATRLPDGFVHLAHSNARNGSAIASPQAVAVSDLNGSWNTICTSCEGRAALFQTTSHFDQNAIVPDSGDLFRTSRSVVVFPHPDSPTGKAPTLSNTSQHHQRHRSIQPDDARWRPSSMGILLSPCVRTEVVLASRAEYVPVPR